MPKTLVRLRTLAFQHQSGRCYYCCCPMWQRSPEAFASTFHLSKRQARTLQCTAEHLHARVDGGGDFECNIVAACRLCNARRHQRKDARDPIHHKAHVARLMGRKRWHDPWVFEKVLHAGAGR